MTHIATSELISVTLDKLSVSPMNVRKTNAKDIDDLLASIPVHGLINKVLTVEPAEKDGYYHVVAGGRRLRALKQLAKEKLIDKKYEVTCALYNGTDATGLSLAENIMRAPMHAADQFDTFRQLADQGQTIEQIALSFGTSESMIRKRLKLGRVAPAILDAFRADKIDQAQVMAYAITDDQDRQLALYKAQKDMPEWRIKQALTSDDVRSDDSRVQIVGLDAYKAAGGTFYEDLFSRNETISYLTDVALLDQLYAEKIESIMSTVKAEGWSGVEVTEDYYSINDSYPGRVYPERRRLSSEEQTELDDLYAEEERLGLVLEVDPDNAEAQAESDAVGQKIKALNREDFSAEQMAEAYALLIIHHGKIDIRRGVTKKKSKAATSVGLSKAILDKEGLPEVSGKLQEELDCVRTVMIASDLANNPAIALVATVHSMALQLVHSSYDAPCRLSYTSQNAATRIQNGSQLSPVAILTEKLDKLREQLPVDEADWWAFFLNMDQASLLNHLAVFAAISVQGFHIGEEARRNLDHIATALNTEPSQHVTLAQLGLLERTPKSYILSAVEKCQGKEKANNLSGLKKGPLVEAATELLDSHWLPLGLFHSSRSDDEFTGSDQDSTADDFSDESDDDDYSEAAE